MRVKFEKGLLGLEDLKNYEIEEVEGNEDFKILRSLDDGDISLVITSPFYVKKDYEIELSKDVIGNLDIRNEKEVLLYTTVTLNTDMSKTTSNLRAPLVINTTNCTGEQIILNKESYKIKHPLIEE